jgi:phosphopantetheine--protein transferase-like protein
VSRAKEWPRDHHRKEYEPPRKEQSDGGQPEPSSGCAKAPRSRGVGCAHLATLCPVDILGLGVDICEIERMERALSRHLTMRERVFTPEEIAYCESKARPAESYAGRFAAREAVIKALGGYRGRRWQDIAVTRGPSGAPSIRLEGNAKQRADVLGVSHVLISFTHERASAVAFAVAVAP